MTKLNEVDYQLIAEAKKVIAKNYDGVKFNHTVGAALLTKEGKIYTGVNVYSVFGACAEMIALGKAISEGERNFLTIVAVNGLNGEIMPPCGNCRQLLSDYLPDGYVIIEDNKQIKKIKIKNLIPYPYHTEY